MAHVVNVNNEKCDVYIGRPSKWGNPYVIGKDGSRSEVIAKYRVWIESKLESDPSLREELVQLRGCKLGCYCAPLACHGDVLKDLARKLS